MEPAPKAAVGVDDDGFTNGRDAVHAGRLSSAAAARVRRLRPCRRDRATPSTIPASVLTIAGSASAGTANGSGRAATFAGPTSVAIDVTRRALRLGTGTADIRAVTRQGDILNLFESVTGGTVMPCGTSPRESAKRTCEPTLSPEPRAAALDRSPSPTLIVASKSASYGCAVGYAANRPM